MSISEDDFKKIDSVAEFGAWLETAGLEMFREEWDKCYLELLEENDPPVNKIYKLVMKAAKNAFCKISHFYANKKFAGIGITSSTFQDYISAMNEGREPNFTGPGKAFNSLFQKIPGTEAFSLFGSLKAKKDRSENLKIFNARMKKQIAETLKEVLPPGVSFQLIDADEKGE